MTKRQSCETCPFMNFPLSDTKSWAQIAEAQRRVTPEYSDTTNAHLTDVERQMRAGLEAHMEECQGYSRWKEIGNIAIDLIAGTGRIEDTGRGTRIVKWAERVCNNPFLKTEEYAQLASEMTHQSAQEYEDSLTVEV